MVVADGFTFADVPVTAPTPESIVTAGEPVAVQASVLVWPTITFAGVAENLPMVGGLPAVTVTGAVTDPNAFVAVRV